MESKSLEKREGGEARRLGEDRRAGVERGIEEVIESGEARGGNRRKKQSWISRQGLDASGGRKTQRHRKIGSIRRRNMRQRRLVVAKQYLAVRKALRETVMQRLHKSEGTEVRGTSILRHM